MKLDKTELANAFAIRVKDEALSQREYEFESGLEREWMAAISKVFLEYECPDCMYSIATGHRS